MKIFCCNCSQLIENPTKYQKCSCSGENIGDKYLCSIKCEREHTGGYTIREIREIEGERKRR